MKKLFLGFLVVLFLGLSVTFANAECYNEVGTRVITPTIHHVFVDTTCDFIPDIVQEYQWNGYRWIATRWWWL
jgi:hypothetical protein